MRSDTLLHHDSLASAGASAPHLRNLRRLRRGLATFTTCAALAATLVTLGACDPERPPALPGNDPAPCELVTEVFAIRDVTLSGTQADASRAFDLDGDGRPDDDLGQLTRTVDALLAAVDRDAWTAHIDDALTDGRAPWLLVVQRCADPAREPAASGEILDFPLPPRSSYARVRLVAGLDADGDGVLELPADAPGVPAIGRLTHDGRLDAQLGSGVAPVGTFLDPLGAAPSSTWRLGDGLTVRLASGDGARDVEIGLAVHGSLEASAAGLADAFTAEEALGGSGNGLDLDTDHDGTVAVGELLASPLVQAALAPDLDLMAPDDLGITSYWPDHDGQLDSCSMYVRARAFPIVTE